MRQHLMLGFRKLESAVTIVNGALLVGITLLIIIQVVARKAGISLAGTEELARFSYVFYTFLAWPIACLYGSNISITMLLDMLWCARPAWGCALLRWNVNAFLSVTFSECRLPRQNRTCSASPQRWDFGHTSGFVTGIVVPVDGGFSAYSGV